METKEEQKKPKVSEGVSDGDGGSIERKEPGLKEQPHTKEQKDTKEQIESDDSYEHADFHTNDEHTQEDDEKRNPAAKEETKNGIIEGTLNK